MYADCKGFYGCGIYDQRPDGVMVFIQVGNGFSIPCRRSTGPARVS